MKKITGFALGTVVAAALLPLTPSTSVHAQPSPIAPSTITPKPPPPTPDDIPPYCPPSNPNCSL